MNCLVCHRKLGCDNTKCKLCGYVNPLIMNGVDPAKLIAQMNDEIEAHRKKFFMTIGFGIIGYHWEKISGRYVLQNELELDFGTLEQAYNNTVWLDRSFDNASSRTPVSVKSFVKSNDSRKDCRISVPNTLNGKKLTLGLSIDDKCQIRFVLKDESGKTLSSEPQYVFE